MEIRNGKAFVGHITSIIPGHAGWLRSTRPGAGGTRTPSHPLAQRPVAAPVRPARCRRDVLYRKQARADGRTDRPPALITSSAVSGLSGRPLRHITQRGHHPPGRERKGCLPTIGSKPSHLPFLSSFPPPGTDFILFSQSQPDASPPSPGAHVSPPFSLPALPSPLPAETSISPPPARCCSSRTLNPDDLLAHTRQSHGQPWDPCHGKEERPSPWHPVPSPLPPLDPPFPLSPSPQITERKALQGKEAGGGETMKIKHRATPSPPNSSQDGQSPAPPELQPAGSHARTAAPSRPPTSRCLPAPAINPPAWGGGTEDPHPQKSRDEDGVTVHPFPPRGGTSVLSPRTAL